MYSLLISKPRPCLVEQEVDEESDVWADHDPRCHGDPNHPSLMNDPTYADGYIMGCCEKAPYEPGCVVSRHEPKVNTPLAKKVRGSWIVSV
jgi:hypothetical protein